MQFVNCVFFLNSYSYFKFFYFYKQFIFDKQTTQFLLQQIEKFNSDSVLCIGTPTIFENLPGHISRYLLDIDDRFSQFYNEQLYTKFNMFNNHFFTSPEAFREFLNKSENLFILIDPPYGGLVKLTAHTLKQIFKMTENKKTVSIFLFYPYFIEPWVNKWLPSFNMLDYKVNTKLFFLCSVID